MTGLNSGNNIEVNFSAHPILNVKKNVESTTSVTIIDVTVSVPSESVSQRSWNIENLSYLILPGDE